MSLPVYPLVMCGMLAMIVAIIALIGSHRAF
jgi:hypothetical protein